MLRLLDLAAERMLLNVRCAGKGENGEARVMDGIARGARARIGRGARVGQRGRSWLAKQAHGPGFAFSAARPVWRPNDWLQKLCSRGS